MLKVVFKHFSYSSALDAQTLWSNLPDWQLYCSFSFVYQTQIEDIHLEQALTSIAVSYVITWNK